MNYNQEQLNKLLVRSARYGLVDLLKECLNLGADPEAYNSYALRWAAQNGHTECVKLLIPVSNPRACNSEALYLAACYGHTECVKLLIPVSNPTSNNSEALYWAARNGHTECVKLLISVSDPKVFEYIKENYKKYRKLA